MYARVTIILFDSVQARIALPVKLAESVCSVRNDILRHFFHVILKTLIGITFPPVNS